MIRNDILISKISDEVKNRLSGEGSGHDWWHIYRVWKMAKYIGKRENADMLIVELATLLHDIADWKFHGGDETVGPRLAAEILAQNGISPDSIASIVKIIEEVSFKGAGIKTEPSTLEGKIVQDADRLDAIGAIGIARAFATGAKFDEVFHDPSIPAQIYASPAEYIASKGKKGRTVVNHFYEKLLLLRDLMNTQTGKKVAEERHRFMEEYLNRFFEEWEGQS